MSTPGAPTNPTLITSIIDSLSSTTLQQYRDDIAVSSIKINQKNEDSPRSRAPQLHLCQPCRVPHPLSAPEPQSAVTATPIFNDPGHTSASLNHDHCTLMPPHSHVNTTQTYESARHLTERTRTSNASVRASLHPSTLNPDAVPGTPIECLADDAPAKTKATSFAMPSPEAIPMRSSSVGKTIPKNKKRHPAIEGSKNVTMTHPKRKPVMSEQVFKELGEDNNTVKRIRELKQQRASRLLHVDVLTDLSDSDTTQPVDGIGPSSSSAQAESPPQLVQDFRATHPVCSAQRRSAIGRTEVKSRDLSKQGDPKRLSSIRWPRRASRDGTMSSISSTEDIGNDDHAHLEVDTFLASPRFSQSTTEPRTGRKISFSEVGDPNGAAIFVCVGMGLSRFITIFYDDLATSLRLRLITPERPGIGDSDAYQDPTASGPLHWHQDILAICKQLHITRFSLLGHSAGAIYALSTAFVLPTFVHGSVYLLAPWIPPSQFSSIADPVLLPEPTTAAVTASLPRSQRLLRFIPVQVLKAANATFLGLNTGSMSPPNKRSSERRASSSSSPGPSPSRSRKVMTTLAENTDDLTEQEAGGNNQLNMTATASPTDAEFTIASEALSASEHHSHARRNVYSSLLSEKIWALATQDTNPSVDLLVCLEREKSVGFRYVDVQQRVVMVHGDQDKRVPVDNVRWLAAQMKHRHSTGQAGLASTSSGCELRVLADEGHGLMANAVVMANVLTEISREVQSGKL